MQAVQNIALFDCVHIAIYSTTNSVAKEMLITVSLEFTAHGFAALYDVEDGGGYCSYVYIISKRCFFEVDQYGKCYVIIITTCLLGNLDYYHHCMKKRKA